MTHLDEQLDDLARHVADLETAPAEVWRQVALPLAVAINALDEAAAASADDHPVILARQLSTALRRRRVVAA